MISTLPTPLTTENRQAHPLRQPARADLPLLRPAFLSGLGVSIPEHRVDNASVAAGLAGTDAEGIETRTGIRYRHFAAEHETTSSLAVSAARAALDEAECDPESLDLILLATASPDHLMPATACRVQQQLGAARAVAMDLGAACSGFLYALWVGQQFIRSGQAESVLVIGAEIMSRIVDPHDSKCAILFGDGAGAAVLTAGRGPYRIGRFWGRTTGSGYEYLIREGGTAPSGDDRTGDGPSREGHYLEMNGRQVFLAAVDGFQQAIARTAEVNGRTPDQFDAIVPHQANARIFRDVAQRLALPEDRFWLNLAEYGNTCAASVPIALAEFRDQYGTLPGESLLLASVGAGMTCGGIPLFAE